MGGETLFASSGTPSAGGLSPRGRGNQPLIQRLLDRRRSIPAWAGKPWPQRRLTAAQRVYPRVGGETRRRVWRKLIVRGLSPRGRGNRRGRAAAGPRLRSIPAWAGKPSSGRSAPSRPRVYPRVGGETASLTIGSYVPRGLSPRGRGNHTDDRGTVYRKRSIPAWAGKPAPGRCAAGSIPAWAGKPRSARGRPDQAEVYPRVGGETSPRSSLRAISLGLSPRGRGNLESGAEIALSPRSIPAWAGKPRPSFWCAPPLKVYPRVGGETGFGELGSAAAGGLSPRGRGNRAQQPAAARWPRSIPAWAGKPPAKPRPAKPGRVYPRVGGETGASLESQTKERGLSPRGRGNRLRGGAPVGIRRSIPAWAGKPLGQPSYRVILRVYPRVGGETAIITGDGTSPNGLSPRGRGNRPAACQPSSPRGSIPAWAGKPGRTCWPARVVKVYPRVGGETNSMPSIVLVRAGLSPRGRGNPGRYLAGAVACRSIPAWAGKPRMATTTDRAPGVYPRVGGETGA